MSEPAGEPDTGRATGAGPDTDAGPGRDASPGTGTVDAASSVFVDLLGIQQGLCGEPLPAPTLRKELPVVDVHIPEPDMRH